MQQGNMTYKHAQRSKFLLQRCAARPREGDKAPWKDSPEKEAESFGECFSMAQL